MTADEIIATLCLTPHPEGGWFRETFRAPAPEGTRSPGTAIYFLLKAGENSHWHKVDAAETWHYYAGAPLTLSIASGEAGPAVHQTLGPALALGEAPQITVPPDHWQAARTTGDYTLVGCTVSPGFEFGGFTLAPPGFTIP
ncbi:cupin domain-containing protein [Maritimibacter sp. UBA3975]|uniref:cupin domain-containing protein n=1 Tax=Maritimibacter sp. UBA3975 TaxID=1946833 RepID=UPI000C0ADBE4|nr:cupin domain-containing protein [Maritimibacter sp. UBA3975]MAM60197.1 cupin [Maritimibacter sp.]|tara:strand:- start:10622 stop:11044 length:423 start_codon:yes stop_codon:yes gene_type:complete